MNLVPFHRLHRRSSINININSSSHSNNRHSSTCIPVQLRIQAILADMATCIRSHQQTMWPTLPLAYTKLAITILTLIYLVFLLPPQAPLVSSVVAVMFQARLGLQMSMRAPRRHSRQQIRAGHLSTILPLNHHIITTTHSIPRPAVVLEEAHHYHNFLRSIRQLVQEDPFLLS